MRWSSERRRCLRSTQTGARRQRKALPSRLLQRTEPGKDEEPVAPGIPGFWLGAMRAHPLISEHVRLLLVPLHLYACTQWHACQGYQHAHLPLTGALTSLTLHHRFAKETGIKACFA